MPAVADSDAQRMAAGFVGEWDDGLRVPVQLRFGGFGLRAALGVVGAAGGDGFWHCGAGAAAERVDGVLRSVCLVLRSMLDVRCWMFDVRIN